MDSEGVSNILKIVGAILLIACIIVGIISCISCTNSKAPATNSGAETKDTTTEEGAGAENGSGENSGSEENKAPVEEVKSTTTLISSTVQEQAKNLYDKHVDKDTTAWESNWSTSSALPTAQIGVSYLESTTVGLYEDSQIITVEKTDSLRPIVVTLKLLGEDYLTTANSCTLNSTSERIYKGIDSGKIGSGMVIVEKSANAADWSRIDSKEYETGLFTTDLRTHYGADNEIEIYSPSGKDLNSGVFIRVTYVYEADYTYTGKNIFGADIQKKESKMFREQCVFYVCNENLEAITLHNLSITNKKFNEVIKDKGDVLEQYKRSETLTDESMTATGFKIVNPMASISVSVSHNGTTLTIPENGEFTESGIYEVILTQKHGKKQNIITIYVDKRSAEDIKKAYFGEGLINGKRIYHEGELPMFEGGYTSYEIAAVDKNHPPIYGTIVNQTTGKKIEIAADRNSKRGDLLEAGEYVATFYNNPTFNTENPAGDTYIITYKFVMIGKDTAPGPQVNKNKLNKYSYTNVSDYYPKYYGITYSSAGPGNITLVFTNYQDAFEFAYNFEKGCVEKQADGTYRYHGSLKVGVKEKFDSVWDLTDATNFFAEQAIQELYFDLSDEFTYLTLDPDTFKDYENLRTLELAKSIVAFKNDEDRALAASKNKLPIIAAKKYQYLTPGLNGEVISGIADFEFVKDDNGYDSDSIVIVDSTGKEIKIQYRMGVAEQLATAGCAAGKITIKEKTVYGDATEYQAFYIPEGVNTTTATITYYEGDTEKTVDVSQGQPFEKIEVSAFSFKSISDELDPYSIVKVIKDGKESVYTFEELLTQSWNEVGEYTIVFVNRLGSKYQIELSIKERIFVSISFSGTGVEGVAPITVSRNNGKVILPVITRYGYTLAGFKDENNVVYKNTIESLDSIDKITLTPIWEAKTVIITIKDSSNTILQNLELKFGDKYTLVPPIVSGGKFTGWTLNGKPYTEEAITIDTEDNIVLIANIESNETEKSTDKPNSDNKATSNSGSKSDGGCGGCNSAISSIAVIAVILLALPVILYRKRKKI